MIKTIKEIEKLKKTMDEEGVDFVSVERRVNCDDNESSFNVSISKYGIRYGNLIGKDV